MRVCGAAPGTFGMRSSSLLLAKDLLWAVKGNQNNWKRDIWQHRKMRPRTVRIQTQAVPKTVVLGAATLLLIIQNEQHYEPTANYFCVVMYLVPSREVLRVDLYGLRLEPLLLQRVVQLPARERDGRAVIKASGRQKRRLGGRGKKSNYGGLLLRTEDVVSAATEGGGGGE